MVTIRLAERISLSSSCPMAIMLVPISSSSKSRSSPSSTMVVVSVTVTWRLSESMVMVRPWLVIDSTTPAQPMLGVVSPRVTSWPSTACSILWRMFWRTVSSSTLAPGVASSSVTWAPQTGERLATRKMPTRIVESLVGLFICVSCVRLVDGVGLVVEIGGGINKG